MLYSILKDMLYSLSTAVGKGLCVSFGYKIKSTHVISVWIYVILEKQHYIMERSVALFHFSAKTHACFLRCHRHVVSCKR